MEYYVNGNEIERASFFAKLRDDSYWAWLDAQEEINIPYEQYYENIKKKLLPNKVYRINGTVLLKFS